MRSCSEREAVDSLRDNSNVIGGWLPSLTFAFACMSKRRSHGCIPEEALSFLSTIFLVPTIGVLASVLFPIVSALKSERPFHLYLWGIITGVFGITVLARARWPLYRQRRFCTFGPRGLDRAHRRLYWVAHVCILISIALLMFVGLMER